jgi:hypothetical protein
VHESQLTGFVRQAMAIAMAVAGAVCGVLALSAGEAIADDGAVQLRSRSGDFCLDTPSGNSFTPTVINPCNGSDFQRWNFTPAGRLESVAFPGMCLSPPDDAMWAHVRPCMSLFGQRWTMQPNGQLTTNFLGCLTVLPIIGGGPGPGTFTATRFCGANSPEQEWDIVP